MPFRWIFGVAVAGLLALVAVVRVGGSDERPVDLSLPAAAIARNVHWSGFDAGMERARDEGKPVLATFVTEWCPYCTKMSTKTWRASAVAERVEELVAVRVDVEPRGDGARLAARYGIHGYPAQLLLDPDGSVVSRFDGYQSPPEFLAWLDAALDGASTASSTPGL